MIVPNLPAHSMKTYEILAPISTHFRVATCQEVECEGYAYGWITAIDESTDLGQRQAYYIRTHSGRAFTTVNAAGMTEFRFPAGQRCFAEHKVPLEREPLYRVRGGDFRGNPRRESREHARAADWVDDFATHQQQLADRLTRG